jgi:type II secretory pathway component PulC
VGSSLSGAGPVLLVALVATLALPAGADEPAIAGDEPVLPTRTLSDLLGAPPMAGLELPQGEIALWDGTLAELCRAVGEIGGPQVALGPEVNARTTVMVAAQLPVTAPRAAEALALAVERAGYTLERAETSWQISRPADATALDVVYVAVQPYTPSAADISSLVFGPDGGDVLHRDLPDLEVSLMALTPRDMSTFFEGLPQPPAPPPPDDRGVVEVDPGHYRLPRAAVADLAETPFQAASLRPRGARGGSDEGFALRRVERDGPLYAIGLRAGDVLSAHDGAPLDAYPDLERAFRALMTAAEVQLTVLRDGERLELRYEIEGPPLTLPPLWGVDDPTPSELRAHHGIVLEGRDTAMVPRVYVLAQRNTLARQIRWSYVLDDEGLVTGIRGSGRRGDLLTLIGLRGGTIILAVDDRPIIDPPSLMSLFTALRTWDEVVLTLEGRLREERFVIRVAGEPDPDLEPWPLDLLTVPGTRVQLRADHGIELTEGAHVFPRAAIADLPRTELTFRPVHDDRERVAGYRLISNHYGDLPDLLGVVPGATLRFLDGEPIESEDDVYAVFEGWLTGDEIRLGIETRAGTAIELHHRVSGDPAVVPATWIGTGVDVEPDLHQRRREHGVQGGMGQFQVPASFVTSLRGDTNLLRTRRSPDGLESFDLFRVGNRSSWFVLGLRSGDRLVGCNGAALTSRADVVAAIEALLVGEPLVLDVMRGETPYPVLVLLSPDG